MGIFTNKQPSNVADPRIVELTQLVKESAAAITILEKEVEIRDEKLKKYDLLIDQIAIHKKGMEEEFKKAIDYADHLAKERDRQEDTIASLENDIKAKNKLIDDMVLERMEDSKVRDSLMKEIYSLRRELKKRTEQYNDLVDLAREKGIIGE